MNPRLDAELLRALPVQAVSHRYDARDCMLYALGVGVGAGANEVDAAALRYVYEKQLQVLPTMAITLGVEGSDFLRDPRTGIDLARVLHGEVAIEMHGALPPGGVVRAETRICDLLDRGPQTGAVLKYERRLLHAEGGGLISVERGSYVLRGNGGFSGTVEPGAARPGSPAAAPAPQRDPEWRFVTRLSHRAALIYRLSGDFNPLHLDPEFARRMGYARPILHGACTFGSIGLDLIRHVCGDDPARLLRLGVRFSAAVEPGAALETRVWRQAAGEAVFETRELDSGRLVLSRGTLDFAGAP
ncbi:Enoyl reductase domain of yeast-type FAS1 [Variovorax sp. SRS16]|uniref:MaoC/PaaZ C-terminal domain-containing protein n=1 Tax=Variovorax sp. SRS16 TaxID=282217 RepID=UPI001318663D|nr:MaoC/PaaZ C-terminal domain-containing protein [Variovorax sp. SRS16]VTU33664.1 Enoyl reductase domain of yeast-type FAS1 [Variovorax sp. SRS16]